MTDFLNKIDSPYLYSELEQFEIERWLKRDLLNSPIADGWIGKTPKYPYRTIYVEKLIVPFWEKRFKAYVIQLNGEIDEQRFWFRPKKTVPLSQAKRDFERYEYWKNTKFAKTQEECDHFCSKKTSTIDWVPVCTQCGKVF
ncbi:hypothetical protein EA716_02300 [Acinetobacter baumannii]|uniref:hypothetical protein n=1 Tax=Acinetobacter baumannii TaxID=470 RepID=UPI000F742BEB|nr:hypothetical protein [Acinetobacter baumannii]RSP97640.1 hypothetical protein EA716_02300 [Acinetobacter baumannii]